MDDLHQLLGSLRAGIGLGQIWIDQVLTNMVLKNLGDESLQGSAARGCLLKHPSALLVPLDCALNCLNLPSDPPKAVQQLRSVPFNMSHL